MDAERRAGKTRAFNSMPARKPSEPSVIPPVDELEQHMAFVFFVQGKTFTEISKLLDIPEGTLRSWKCRGKWDLGIEEARQLAASKRPPVAEQPLVVAAIESRDTIAKEYEADMQQAAKKFGKHVSNLDAGDIIESAPKLDAADKMFGRRLKLDVDETAGQGGHISLTFLGAAAEGSVKIIEQKPRELADA